MVGSDRSQAYAERNVAALFTALKPTAGGGSDCGDIACSGARVALGALGALLALWTLLTRWPLVALYSLRPGYRRSVLTRLPRVARGTLRTLRPEGTLFPLWSRRPFYGRATAEQKPCTGGKRTSVRATR